MLPFMEVKRPFSDEDWNNTPEPVKAYIVHLEDLIKQLIKRQDELEKRTEKLEAQSKMNSQNSSKPPSSDSPFKRPKREKKKSKRKRGAQKGHKGHRQQMLEPNQTKNIFPETCSCGHSSWEPGSVAPFYTHQHIELPEIELEVMHLILHKGSLRLLWRNGKSDCAESIFQRIRPPVVIGNL
jgi:transposase